MSRPPVSRARRPRSRRRVCSWKPRASATVKVSPTQGTVTTAAKAKYRAEVTCKAK